MGNPSNHLFPYPICSHQGAHLLCWQFLVVEGSDKTARCTLCLLGHLVPCTQFSWSLMFLLHPSWPMELGGRGRENIWKWKFLRTPNSNEIMQLFKNWFYIHPWTLLCPYQNQHIIWYWIQDTECENQKWASVGFPWLWEDLQRGLLASPIPQKPPPPLPR